jgi:hypothetical protein
MNVGIGNEAAQFSFQGIHKSDFWYSAEGSKVAGLQKTSDEPLGTMLGRR